MLIPWLLAVASSSPSSQGSVPPTEDPDAFFVGRITYDYLGYCVAPAGDVNGDGYDDVIVGKLGPLGDGDARLHLGGPGGPSTTVDWVASTPASTDRFGACVASAGDVDGDGYDDVLVSAPWGDELGQNSGSAYLYRGSATGPSATPDWSAHGDVANGWFGQSVASAGDVDGDGFDDVLVGASRVGSAAGRVYLFRGGPAGLDASATWIAVSPAAGAWFGHSVSGAGDVDADGYDDVIVGAPMLSIPSNAEGAAFLYRGSPPDPRRAPTGRCGADRSALRSASASPPPAAATATASRT